MIKITYDKTYFERLVINLYASEGYVKGPLSILSLDSFMQIREGDTFGHCRYGVKSTLQEIFPDSLVTVGGHHVAVHNPINGERMFILESDATDFN